MNRWGRRLLIGAVAFVLVLTLACLVVNAVTTPPRTLPATAGEDLRVGSVRVHVERWGPREPRPGGPAPVLLVHGFAESAVAWRPVGPRLGADRPVVALDLPGFGYSDATGRYALPDQVALVTSVLDALGWRRAVLVGHSMGAAVVGGVALDHPDRVASVIFADGDGLPFRPEDADTLSRPGRGAWIARVPPFVSAYRLGTRWPWLSERLVRSSCGSTCRGLTPGLVEDWMRPLRQGAVEAAWSDMLGQGVLALTPEQERAITVPRGLIWGSEDARSGGSVVAAQENLGHPPLVWLPGAGHVSMVADPDGFAAAVRRLAG